MSQMVYLAAVHACSCTRVSSKKMTSKMPKEMPHTKMHTAQCVEKPGAAGKVCTVRPRSIGPEARNRAVICCRPRPHSLIDKATWTWKWTSEHSKDIETNIVWQIPFRKTLETDEQNTTTQRPSKVHQQHLSRCVFHGSANIVWCTECFTVWWTYTTFRASFVWHKKFFKKQIHQRKSTTKDKQHSLSGKQAEAMLQAAS